jgi:hypothetical protein
MEQTSFPRRIIALIHWLVNLVQPYPSLKKKIQVGYLWYQSRNKLFLIRGDIIYSVALQRKSHVCIPFWELRVLSPNFPIHVSVSDLYIPRIGAHIFLQQNRLDIGTVPRNSFSGNICFEYCVFAVWNPTLYNRFFFQPTKKISVTLYVHPCNFSCL